jgi:hypothetical protein
MSAFAPRALLPRHRLTVIVELTPLEARACRYAPETIHVGDHWFARIATLREAGR